MIIRTLLLGLLLFSCSSAVARELWTQQRGDEESEVKLSTAFKATGLATAPSSDTSLSSQNASGASLFRLRIEPTAQMGSWNLDVVYDNEITFASSPTFGLVFAFPSNALTPYRLWPIGVISTSGNLVDQQELDRAFVSYHSARLDLTVGRQPIGWGRGQIYSAVDVFSPFIPLQIDQEWRRGVDAIRGDLKLSDTTSFELVLVGGPSWYESALGGRLRGYLGPLDAELIIAKRAQDMMYGATSSASIGDFEVHGELAFFETPGDVPSPGFFGDTRLVPKAVLGVSDNLLVGNGLKTTLEYHYSGFGAATAQGISALLVNPSFQARYVRGDTQILGDQVVALSTSYTFNERWSAGLTFIQSLIDASGIFEPSAVWDFSESASLLGTVYAAYGAASSGGILQSQFGAVPPTVIFQLRIYD